MEPIMTNTAIGVIGGSGLYAMEGLTETREHLVETPFGATSDAVVTGRLEGVPVAFLARHGKGHRLIPSEVPYRANVYALKSLGVRYLISVSAVGSLREAIEPLDLVLPDQFIDLTRHRESTFFGQGAVAHVSMAKPVCAALRGVLAEAVADCALKVRLHRDGTYVCIEGPVFSSQAESNWYRSMGAAVIGMTSMPEAKLAREAEIAYATLALVTDYDCWHPHEAHVSAELALANLQKNAANAQMIIRLLAQRLHRAPPQSAAHTALSTALVTRPEQMSAETRVRLRALISMRTG
ncbi:MAG TPA: S-methyl-5'-thioadenosine phosphorylase [Steroidobacteraceae bacterium]